MIQLRLLLFGVSIITAAGVAVYTYIRSNRQREQHFQHGRPGMGPGTPPPPPSDNRRSDDGNRDSKTEISNRKPEQSKRPECSICLEDSDDVFVSLDCGHSFHMDCIKTWLPVDRSCPNCRSDLRRQKKD